MALFKINRGSEKNLPAGITDGYAYFCTDNQNFYIDFIDSSGVSTRKKLGVEFAEKLRYLKDGVYVEIDPTTLVVKTDLDNVAKVDADNIFTGNNHFINGDLGLFILERESDDARGIQISPPAYDNPTAKITTYSSGESINRAPISFEGSTLQNIGSPTEDTDASTKKYVDDGLKLKAGLSTDNTFTGANTFSGKVTVSTAPTADTDVATKKYVDNNISTCVPKNTVSSETWTFTLADGSTVTKNIVLSSSL